MRILPVYKGYSVDSRLREFRKARIGKRVEFIDFASAEGVALYWEMEHLGMSFEPADHETEEGRQYLKDLNIATYGPKAAKAMNQQLDDRLNQAAEGIRGERGGALTSQASMTLFKRLYQWLQRRQEQRKHNQELTAIRAFKGRGKVSDEARRRIHLKGGYLTKNRQERFIQQDEER